jgi:hypothetical protein
MPHKIFIGSAIAVSVLLSTSALAATIPDYEQNQVSHEANVVERHVATQVAERLKTQIHNNSEFSVFAPKLATLPHTIQYKYWDDTLSELVLNMGRSVRIRKGRPDSVTGTRVPQGHSSPYRLEGSRIRLSYLNVNYVRGLTQYREELVQLANDMDIQSLNKKEQLAFWYNLHNVLLIETLAKNYPLRKPSELKVGNNKELLHDAKLIEIKGVPLSLRNIREDIVYKNWSNPDVIYGFYMGDIGGPAIMAYAITAKNINYVISTQATEFVTSLRGFNVSSQYRNISKIYEDAAPYYFKNWPADLEHHLKLHADGDVATEISQNKPFRVARYDKTISDLVGGKAPFGMYPKIQHISSTAQGQQFHSQQQLSQSRDSAEVRNFFKELRGKIRIMHRKGMLQGKNEVVIVDIDTQKRIE